MASGSELDELSVRLQRGTDYYKNNQFSKAAVVFKELVGKCPCGVPVRTSPCVCKSLVPAIVKGTLERELRKPCICSAKSSTRCKNASHVQALDYLVAMYEAKGMSDKATSVAESMIHLAPRDPRGFLRLGKQLCRKDSHQAAFLTYQQGIDIVSKKNPSHELLPVLHRVREKARLRALALDPLKALPIELVAMIFGHLSFSTLCRCLRVSRTWKVFLTRSDETIQSLWRIQRFGACKKPVIVPVLSRYYAYAGGHIEELHIAKCSEFQVDEKKLSWIARACRTLKALSFQSQEDPRQTVWASFPTITPSKSQLTRLYFGFYTPYAPSFLISLISLSAETLQELTILNVPTQGRHFGVWPVLEQLRILRLGTDLQKCVFVDMASLMRLTPNLEELWLQSIISTGIETQLEGTVWPRLKRLRLRHTVNWPLLTIVPGPFRLSSNLEELSIHDSRVAHALLERPFLGDPSSYPSPKKLRVFSAPDLQALTLQESGQRSLNFSDPAENWIRPGLESGSLEELHMGEFPRALPSWFKSDKVRHLCVKQLFWSMDTSSLDDFLSEVLDRFPNVETLETGEVGFSNSALGKAIEKGVIKTVYCARPYSERAELIRWALEKHNVSFNSRLSPHDFAPPPI